MPPSELSWEWLLGLGSRGSMLYRHRTTQLSGRFVLRNLDYQFLLCSSGPTQGLRGDYFDLRQVNSNDKIP